MRIFGVDFTSAPGGRKPITCASTVLESSTLHVNCLASLTSLETFNNFLHSGGPWVAGMDFPFGQPRRLVENLGWPHSWEAYVEHSASLGMSGFESLLATYREQRPKGDKQHLRVVDREAGARSPMMLYGVPVGRMFFRGAPFLKRSGVSVLPCRPREDERVVLEAYPALVARRLIGHRSYKGDRKADTSAALDARRELVDQLMSQVLEREYGVRIVIDAAIRDELIEESSADGLDSVLCALQAAWAWGHRDHGWGIPAEVDPLEGWIVDPALTGTTDVSTTRH